MRQNFGLRDPFIPAHAAAESFKVLIHPSHFLSAPTSDLIEMNVTSTLNSSLMFYRGLHAGGALQMTEAEMLADIWSQEEDARREARDWLGAFFTVAYQPLEIAELQRYAEFYRTSEGRQLNQAIFEVFNAMYEETSYLLGLAVAKHITSEPL